MKKINALILFKEERDRGTGKLLSLKNRVPDSLRESVDDEICNTKPKHLVIPEAYKTNLLIEQNYKRFHKKSNIRISNENFSLNEIMDSCQADTQQDYPVNDSIMVTDTDQAKKVKRPSVFNRQQEIKNYDNLALSIQKFSQASNLIN